MAKKKSPARTELEASLTRVSNSDALAKIAAESQVPRVIVWESSKGSWSRYAVKENDLKIGFAESFDGAMKKAKKLFPLSRVEHDPKMTDKVAKGLKKKFEATVEAAGGTVQAPTPVIKDKKGKGPGPAPKEKEPAKEEEIADLLEELKNTTDGEEKKRIRRKLRSRGHYGGLGATKTEPKGKAKAKAPKPDPDEDDDLDMDDEGDDD